MVKYTEEGGMLATQQATIIIRTFKKVTAPLPLS